MTKQFRAWAQASFSGLLVLGCALVARAQDAAEERATSFKAVQGAVKEDVAGGPLLVSAYGLILLIVVGYGVRLVRMQQRASDDLARLERQIKR
jgi:hypothetical protein